MVLGVRCDIHIFKLTASAQSIYIPILRHWNHIPNHCLLHKQESASIFLCSLETYWNSGYMGEPHHSKQNFRSSDIHVDELALLLGAKNVTQIV